MLSARGGARLGLGAACLVFITSIAVIGLGAADARRAPLPVPSPAPAFELPDTAGRSVTLIQQRGAVTVLCFTSIHCPPSNEYGPRLAELACRHERDKRVRFFAVNSNVGTGAAGEQAAREIAVQTRTAGLTMPQLLDPAADTARRYGVDHTPAFVVVDAAGQVRYRGAFDDNRNPAEVKASYLQEALESVLQGKLVARPVTQTPGCVIPQ